MVTGASAVFKVADHPTMGANFTWTDRFGEPYLAFRERADCWLLPRECFPIGDEDQRVDAPVKFPRWCSDPRDDSQLKRPCGGEHPGLGHPLGLERAGLVQGHVQGILEEPPA